jgi:hypothetical protein
MRNGVGTSEDVRVACVDTQADGSRYASEAPGAPRS